MSAARSPQRLSMLINTKNRQGKDYMAPVTALRGGDSSCTTAVRNAGADQEHSLALVYELL